jgi:cell division protein ZapA
MIKKLEQSYAVRDKQDVLAMCALQYATQLKNKPESKNIETSKEFENVLELINVIDVHLNLY